MRQLLYIPGVGQPPTGPQPLLRSAGENMQKGAGRPSSERRAAVSGRSCTRLAEAAGLALGLHQSQDVAYEEAIEKRGGHEA